MAGKKRGQCRVMGFGFFLWLMEGILGVVGRWESRCRLFSRPWKNMSCRVKNQSPWKLTRIFPSIFSFSSAFFLTTFGWLYYCRLMKLNLKLYSSVTRILKIMIKNILIYLFVCLCGDMINQFFDRTQTRVAWINLGFQNS